MGYDSPIPRKPTLYRLDRISPTCCQFSRPHAWPFPLAAVFFIITKGARNVVEVSFEQVKGRCKHPIMPRLSAFDEYGVSGLRPHPWLFTCSCMSSAGVAGVVDATLLRLIACCVWGADSISTPS